MLSGQLLDTGLERTHIMYKEARQEETHEWFLTSVRSFTPLMRDVSPYTPNSRRRHPKLESPSACFRPQLPPSFAV